MNLTNNDLLFTSDGIIDNYNVTFSPNVQIQIINLSTITPSIDYSKFTLSIVQILQMLIVFVGIFTVMMAVRRVYMGDMDLGELFTFLVMVSFILLIMLFLCPILVSYIAKLIR